MGLHMKPIQSKDETINLQISKIRTSRKRLQREASVKPLDKERVRRYAKDVADNAKAFHRLIKTTQMRGIEDRRICTAIEHQLEALNIFNRQLFILSVGPGYKFLPNECEDTIVQFEKTA